MPRPPEIAAPHTPAPHRRTQEFQNHHPDNIPPASPA